MSRAYWQGDDRVKCSCISIGENAETDILVGVCYRPPK